MRRRFWIVALLLVLSISLFAKVTITAAVWSWDLEKYKKIAAEFTKLYPDIEVQFVVNEPDVNGFLTAQVAAKKPLPDVVVQSWESLAYPVSQGWVYPLDELLKNDADFNKVPKILEKLLCTTRRLMLFQKDYISKESISTLIYSRN
ncbi:extracellular solute-binding protein [Fervidobacterium sp.]